MKQSEKVKQRVSLLAGKTLAVGSGKGGVGKSITSVNLAVCFARQGMRTALCDLDPLSDTAVILDVRTPEQQLSAGGGLKDSSLDAYVLPVLPRLDILFPASKTAAGQSSHIRDLIFHRFARELNARYDVLVLDLPAGIGREENLNFLPLVNNLIVVVNPEPTSHVSAGGYIRAALDIHPAIKIHLWHNRYRVDPAGTFNTRAVAANYNRFVDPELRIRPDEVTLKDMAFVPEDPSLNLLKGGLPVALPVLYRLSGALQTLKDRVVMTAPLDGGMDTVTAKLLRYHLARLGKGDPGDRGRGAIDYLEAFLPPGKELNPQAREAAVVFCGKIAEDPVYRTGRTAIDALAAAAEDLLERDRLFSPALRGIRKGSPDVATAEFLRAFVRSRYYRDRFMRYSAGLVLYYYALYRLLLSKPVSDLFLKLIPVRKEGGKNIRDRRRQIAFLLEKDQEYHRRYFQFVKQLFPLALKQVGRVSSSLGVRNLILPDLGGGMNRNAYLKLLADVVQDTANSGLGILSGQRFNAASTEMEKGARNIRITMFGGG